MTTILILDDNQSLLARLSKNITKFNVITATTIEKALETLKTQDVSFIAVDYDLGNAKTGDMLYDLLFKSGKSIPAIVFSSNDLSDPSQSYLIKQGFSKILSKVDEEVESVSDLIEKAAQEILNDCKARCWQVEKKTEYMKVGNHPIPFDRQVKTIDEWIKLMRECKFSLEQEKELRNLIAEHCKIYDNSMGNIP